jgi:hypothetical protein
VAVLDVAHRARLRLRPGRRLHADPAAARALRGRREVTRAQRLRAALEGTGMEDQAAGLAALPAAQVDLICSALKASGRAALARDKARRRQRVADRRKHGHVEDDQQAAATERQTLAPARRAGSNLDTLARLKEHYDDGPSVLALAVGALRAEGYSDGQIGQADAA